MLSQNNLQWIKNSEIVVFLEDSSHFDEFWQEVWLRGDSRLSLPSKTFLFGDGLLRPPKRFAGSGNFPVWHLSKNAKQDQQSISWVCIKISKTLFRVLKICLNWNLPLGTFSNRFFVRRTMGEVYFVFFSPWEPPLKLRRGCKRRNGPKLSVTGRSPPISLSPRALFFRFVERRTRICSSPAPERPQLSTIPSREQIIIETRRRVRRMFLSLGPDRIK
jgi:hypothetical protein